MRAHLVAIGALCLIACPVGVAAADDEAHTHDGFYLGVALGAGYVGANVSTSGAGLEDTATKARASPIGTSLSGFSLPWHVLVGGTPVRGLAIGGGHSGNIVLGATASTEGRSATLSTFTFGITGPFVDFYPLEHGGFHALATLGLADVVETSGSGTSGLLGFGGALGLGHGLWVSDDWSVGLLARGQWGGVWSLAERVSSPISADLQGSGVRESQALFNAGLLVTATYH